MGTTQCISRFIILAGTFVALNEGKSWPSNTLISQRYILRALILILKWFIIGPAKTTHEHIHQGIMEESFQSPLKTSDEHSPRVCLPMYKTNSGWLMSNGIRTMFADLWSSKRWTWYIMNAIPITAFTCQHLCFERQNVCVLQWRQYFT